MSDEYPSADRTLYGEGPYEGPQQAVDTPWGRELLPTMYHLDPNFRKEIEANGRAPLGYTMDTAPGAPPVYAPGELPTEYDDLLAQQQAGAPAVDAVSGGAPITPDTPIAPTLEAPAAPQLTQQGAPGADGLHTPVPAGSTPASATPGEYPQLPTFDAIPAPPQPPPLTGDPRKDAQQNLVYQRDLASYHATLSNRTAQLNAHAANVNSVASGKQAEAQKRALEQKQAELKQYEALRQQRQSAIDAAVTERAEARKGLEGGSDEDRLHGGRLVAAIAGGIGASLQALGAAQMGRPQQFENQALKTIEAMQKQKYQKRKDRLAAAGDSLLEARYNAKDSQEAHRAALNDLDASSAAEWKLIGLEAESQLKRLGAAKADIDRNEVIVKARQEQAKAEGQIHDREESHEIAKGHNKALESIARATLSQRRTEHHDTEEDRRLAREAREREDRDKAEAKNAGKAIFNPRTGEKIDDAPTKERAAAAQANLNQLNNIRGDLGALKSHVQNEGPVANLPLVGPVTDAARTRESLAKSVVTGLAAYKQLGAISADDRKIIEGMTGGGLASVMGLNSNQIDSLQAAIDRAEKNALRSQGIQSGPAETPRAPPAERNDRISLPPAEAPAARKPTKAPKLNGADAEIMLDAHRKGDHSFDAILKANKLL